MTGRNENPAPEGKPSLINDVLLGLGRGKTECRACGFLD